MEETDTAVVEEEGPAADLNEVFYRMFFEGLLDKTGEWQDLRDVVADFTRFSVPGASEVDTTTLGGGNYRALQDFVIKVGVEWFCETTAKAGAFDRLHEEVLTQQEVGLAEVE